MKKFLCVATIAALTTLGTAAFAEAPKMHGRAALTYISPSDNIEVDGDKVDSSIDSALGLGLGWEYRFNERVGLDINWFYAKHDVVIEGEKFDSTKFMPITVGANFHLTPDKKVDFFVGPLLGYVLYNDLENSPLTVKLDNDIVYGANLGLEYPFKDKVAFYASLKYLKAGADAKVQVEESSIPVRAKVDVADGKVDIDPLVLQVGVSFRY